MTVSQPVGTQLTSLVTNHGSQDQGFDAGPPTNSLSASAGRGVLTKISGAPLRAGCNGKPRPRADATYMAQAGWLEVRDNLGRPGRVPVMVDIKATFGTTACQFDRSATDSICTGCPHGAQAGAPP